MRKQAGQRSEKRPIRRPQQRATACFPSEHGQLMPQHEQLDVLGELAPAAPNEQTQQGRERQISERKQHAPMVPDSIGSRSTTDEPRF
jgi:hypothetical protein